MKNEDSISRQIVQGAKINTTRYVKTNRAKILASSDLK